MTAARGSERAESDRAELADWCLLWLGSRPVRRLFAAGNLSRVHGLVLEDRRRVVVKVRAPRGRLAACVAVQQKLWESGFPCPRPLAGPAPLGGLTATAESYAPGGHLLRPSRSSAARFGEALARLIRSAAAAVDPAELEPPPAWLRWNHGSAELWPAPESTRADLNTVEGPQWLNDAAARARTRLLRFDAPAVLGHGDFESQNLRWRAGRLHMVHDWDSVVALPEAVIAGAAAAAHPATGVAAAAADVPATSSFLNAYARHRGRPWSQDEQRACWAAGLWVLAYNAKVELAEGRTALMERIARDADQRLTLAVA